MQSVYAFLNRTILLISGEKIVMSAELDLYIFRSTLDKALWDMCDRY